MSMARAFKETIMADLHRDRAFRVAYLRQAIGCLHSGEFSVLSENSNPHADKLFAILGRLQEFEHVKVTVLPASRARGRRCGDEM
jgi:hypothetical protein